MRRTSMRFEIGEESKLGQFVGNDGQEVANGTRACNSRSEISGSTTAETQFGHPARHV